MDDKVYEVRLPHGGLIHVTASFRDSVERRFPEAVSITKQQPTQGD